VQSCTCRTGCSFFSCNPMSGCSTTVPCSPSLSSSTRAAVQSQVRVQYSRCCTVQSSGCSTTAAVQSLVEAQQGNVWKDQTLLTMSAYLQHAGEQAEPYTNCVGGLFPTTLCICFFVSSVGIRWALAKQSNSAAKQVFPAVVWVGLGGVPTPPPPPPKGVEESSAPGISSTKRSR
jgi:hypothetical protein